METLKITAFLYSAAYLAILSSFWSMKDAQNQFFKILTLGTSIFAIILATTWVKGIWWSWFFALPTTISGLFGLIFLFASGPNSLFTIIFKLIGTIAFFLSIVYFSV